MKRTILALVALAAALALAWAIQQRIRSDAAGPAGPDERPPVAVELGPIERGPLTARRTFSGALEAVAEFVVAAKVSGRVERLAVDLGDPVERGQVVAWLEDDEYVQAVAQAEAELAVARANHAEATSALEIAKRALQRIETLRGEGVVSESQSDVAMADELSARAAVEVAVAQITRAEAAAAAARIRLGYTKVIADWTEGDGQRIVSQRSVSAGDHVSAGAPIFSIVELDPILGVVHVPERDYAQLRIGQPAELATDAYPGEPFQGLIARIAPVFRRATRQVRVELEVENRDQRLKPGMFVRATIVVGRVEDATVVPFLALTQRDDRTGVFVVAPGGATVSWVPVEVGIREGERVEVRASGLTGRVVTLGQDLCDDGSPIIVPGEDLGAARGSEEAAGAAPDDPRPLGLGSAPAAAPAGSR